MTAGGVRADTSVGDETGYFGGVGLIFQVNRDIEVGGEVLYSSFDDVGPGEVDGSILSYRIRASFRF